MTDHDQLFKRLLKLFFPDLLKLTVPEATKRLDLERVKFLEQESFSDVPAGDRVLLDLVAEVPTLDDAEIETILFLVEVEDDFRRASERRFWRYYAHMRLNHDHPVLLIVIWRHGGSPGVSRQEIVDSVLGEVVHRLTYVSFSLSGSSADEFLARREPLAWALAALMRTSTPDRVEHKLACLRAIAHAELDDVERFVLLDTVETYLQLNDEETERYTARLASETEDKEVRKMAMTWSERLEAKGYERGVQQGIAQGVQQGIERGVQQGIERGRAQGQHRLLQRQLERRFGSLPEGALERLAAIRDPSALDRLGERLLEARSLEELGLVA